MKLAVINGSPRGDKSNSKRMSGWILDNEGTQNNIDYKTYFLNKINRHQDYIDEMDVYDGYLFVFPLYVDSLPGITKAFFDKMTDNKALFEGKPVYFIIHSGFPEMVQSLSLKRYTKYFASKLMGMDYKGTLIMAGSEALQSAPDGFFGKKVSVFNGLEKSIANNEPFNEELSYKISGFYKMNTFQRTVFTLNPLKDFYWNYVLKKNDAKKDVKNAPYLLEDGEFEKAVVG